MGPSKPYRSTFGVCLRLAEKFRVSHIGLQVCLISSGEIWGLFKSCRSVFGDCPSGTGKIWGLSKPCRSTLDVGLNPTDEFRVCLASEIWGLSKPYR